MTENTNEEKMIKELDALYEKAMTEEDYKIVIEKGEEIVRTTDLNVEEIIAQTFNVFWAQYYLLLKWNKDINARKAFLEIICEIFFRVKKPENIIRCGYLFTAVANLIPIPNTNEKEITEIQTQIEKIAQQTGNVPLFLQMKNIHKKYTN